MSPGDDMTESTETPTDENVVSTASPTRKYSRKYLLEMHLKNILMEDMTIRQQIKNAKTNAKKNHFKKKLRKTDIQAKKFIAALRKEQAPNESSAL